MNIKSFAVRSSLAALASSALILGTSAQSFASIRPATTTISGAGSSFDAPLFSNQIADYDSNNSTQINYNANGSGAGQSALNAGTVDFGAFDVPMRTSDGYSHLSELTQFPVALGGVAVIANLPDYGGELKLTGNIIAQIYLGQITQWSQIPATFDTNGKPHKKGGSPLDPGLSSLTGNENSISVVHRLDSSGTSYIFTDFLSHTNSTWKTTPGLGPNKAPAWPVGAGGNHNSGVQALVDSTVGSIGYVGSDYYIQNQTQGVIAGSILNKDKTNYLPPLLDYIADDAAVKGKVTVGGFSVVYQTGATSYPVTGYSWAGLYKKGSEWSSGRTVCNATVTFFNWETAGTGSQSYGDGGQSYASGVDFVPLPVAEQNYAGTQLEKVQCAK